jgi:hypothetical protein
MAIWAKKPEAECSVLCSTSEMRDCHLIQEGNDPDPGAAVLMVSTGASAPKCFLTSRMNSVVAAILKIELIHSMGNCVVALREPDGLHGLPFAFVGKRVGVQLPSPFLESQNGEEH